MAKWHGKLGFHDSYEARPGIWENGVVERMYTGDSIRDTTNVSVASSVEPNITPRVQISILCDDFAMSHISDLLFVEYMGKPWIASSFEYLHPRINITLGGAYNGKRAAQLTEQT